MPVVIYFQMMQEKGFFKNKMFKHHLSRFFEKIPISRAGCSFASMSGFCNGMVTRVHLEIKQRSATRLVRLADLPAAGYTPVVDGDWKLP